MRLAIHPLNADSFMSPFFSGTPYSENPSETSDNNPSSFSRPIEQKEIVLVLSKEPDTRFLFKTLLEMWNYRAETAESFEELIAVAEATLPHLVLIDTSLPFVDNMTKMQRMRQSELFSKLPIVLISGHAQPRYRNLALSLGADDFLVKPVDFDVLEDCLKKNINRGEKPKGELL
jgi:DNA-binding response OmpR family regulator